MGLRVISGSARGRKLKSVPGDTTRPITDKVKEALFDIIGGDVLDSRWWDMFGGTGAVGIEALSRGAAFVRFTDLNRHPVDIIKTNLAATLLTSRAETMRTDAVALLASNADRRFHYIYIAPPQFQQLWSKAVLLLDQNPNWLEDDGWAIVQIAPKEHHDLQLLHLAEFDQRRYGSTLLVFYERSSAPAK